MLRGGPRRPRASGQRRVERVPDDGGEEVQLEPRRPDPRPRLPRVDTTPTRSATSSRSPARRPRTPTSRGRSSCAATTTSSWRRGATSSTGRSRARTRTSARCPTPGALTPEDEALLAEVEAGFASVGSLIEAARFRSALQEAMRLAALGNQYIAEQAPWAKLEDDRERAGTILYVALRAIDSLKVLLTPFLPFSAQRLHELLGYDGVIAGPLEFRDRLGGAAPSHVSSPATTRAGPGAGSRARCLPGRRSASRHRCSQSSMPSGSSPRSSRGWKPPRPRDRLARAPRRVRRAGGGARRARADSRRDARSSRSALESTRAALRSRSPTRTRASSPRWASTRTRLRRPTPGGLDELRELLAHPEGGRRRRDGARRRCGDPRLPSSSADSSMRSSRSRTSSASRS